MQRDKVRKLTDAARAAGLYVPPMQVQSFGDIVSKRTGESAVYWNHDENAFYKPKRRSWILAFSRKERKDRKAYRYGGVLQDFQAYPLF